jgi:hypothetical protein
MQINQPKGVKPKMSGHKLRWCKQVKGVKAKRRKINGVKQGLGALMSKEKNQMMI